MSELSRALLSTRTTHGGSGLPCSALPFSVARSMPFRIFRLRVAKRAVLSPPAPVLARFVRGGEAALRVSQRRARQTSR